jgi:hypothetical protein
MKWKYSKGKRKGRKVEPNWNLLAAGGMNEAQRLCDRHRQRKKFAIFPPASKKRQKKFSSFNWRKHKKEQKFPFSASERKTVKRRKILKLIKVT